MMASACFPTVYDGTCIEFLRDAIPPQWYLLALSMLLGWVILGYVFWRREAAPKEEVHGDSA